MSLATSKWSFSSIILFFFVFVLFTISPFHLKIHFLTKLWALNPLKVSVLLQQDYSAMLFQIMIILSLVVDEWHPGRSLLTGLSSCFNTRYLNTQHVYCGSEAPQKTQACCLFTQEWDIVLGCSWKKCIPYCLGVCKYNVRLQCEQAT